MAFHLQPTGTMRDDPNDIISTTYASTVVDSTTNIISTTYARTEMDSLTSTISTTYASGVVDEQTNTTSLASLHKANTRSCSVQLHYGLVFTANTGSYTQDAVLVVKHKQKAAIAKHRQVICMSEIRYCTLILRLADSTGCCSMCFGTSLLGTARSPSPTSGCSMGLLSLTCMGKIWCLLSDNCEPRKPDSTVMPVKSICPVYCGVMFSTLPRNQRRLKSLY